MEAIIAVLEQHGIQPTPQRISVATYVLKVTTHPTADEVWERVRRDSPTLSRATVYNTLNLFVEKGLLVMQVLKEGTAVFEPHIGPHHHFIDTETGRIYDVPWEAIKVSGHRALAEFEVENHQVVMRGRKRTKKAKRKR